MHRVRRLHKPRIYVIGCGGTGSHVVNQIVDVHSAMVNQGHEGVSVRAFDGDSVAYSNVGRQAFYLQDVGQPKSKVLIERINMHYGLNWSHRGNLMRKEQIGADIIVSCVDTKASRKIIKSADMHDNTYIIECGNARSSGQVILGQHKGDLPNPYNEHPALTKGKEPKGEGCLDPYYKQDLPVNRQVAVYVQQIIWNLLRKHELSHRGVFFDLAQFASNGVQTTERRSA